VFNGINEKVFATGMSGTLGSRLSRAVRKLNFDLADKSASIGNPSEVKGGTLIHLAGIVGTKAVLSEKLSTEVNVFGAARLATEVARSKMKRFIYVSTGHVYARSSEPSTENAPLDPSTEYSRQKMEAEFAIKKVLEQSEVELVTVRLFSILGSGMPGFTLGGQVDRAATTPGNEQINFSDDVRSFISIADAAIHIEQIASMPDMPRVVNLCSSKPLSVKEAVRRYCNSAGLRLPEFGSGYSDAPFLCGDNSALKARYADFFDNEQDKLILLMNSLEELSFSKFPLNSFR
jgi:nucleoside-diphosphate-sugar epimerase